MALNDPVSAEKALIVDFGSQYTQLIARRVRELNVYSEIHAWQDINRYFLNNFYPRCIILSGGPESILDAASPIAHPDIFAFGAPVLGICYGMQLMASQLGGDVEKSLKREFGRTEVRLLKTCRLFQGLGECLDVWMSHGDRVVVAPAGFESVAVSANSDISVMANEQRRLYGLQFHPEVTHTPQGMKILHNFVVEIAACGQQWKSDRIADAMVARIREQVGADEGVVLGLSGGVDSSVVAMLLHRALGDRLHCIFIDTGLLRLGEAEQIVDTFQRQFGIDLIFISASERFFRALRGIDDPEKKRLTIGNLFVEIFEEQAKHLNNIQWLAQGTIYPDVIESASVTIGGAQLIKSHHNVGGLPECMYLQLLEPLTSLFKDEVRCLGRVLGLSEELLLRHPFPGPGLAVRVLGEVRPAYVAILKQADDIFIGELKRQGFYDRVGQAFAVFLPVKSVGVMGDGRNYNYIVVLRAVETTDFMTAARARFPDQFLDFVAGRIINEVEGVSRVCYDISSKPPATIEWE